MLDWVWGEQLKRKAPYFPGHAAGIAFFFLLSLVPFLVVTLSIIKLVFTLDLQTPIAAILNGLIPPNDLINVEKIVETASQAGRRGVLTFTFIIALWSTSNFMTSIVHALHFIFSTEDHLERKGWIARLYSFGLLIVWSAFIMITSLLLVFAPAVEALVETFLQLPNIQWTAIRSGRFVIIFVMMLLAFWSTYRLTAPSEVVKKRFWQAALIATLGWMTMGYLFTHIMPAIWEKSIVYGTLGSIVITLFWAYSSAWVVLIGACWIARHPK
jgi:membrane protein